MDRTSGRKTLQVACNGCGRYIHDDGVDWVGDDGSKKCTYISVGATEPGPHSPNEATTRWLYSSLRAVAHDSGDGETIAHCPFCGSGAVVGGQDGTVSCVYCKKAFTVQVQPVFKNMPQTVNGAPYNIPGMPGGGPDAGAADVGMNPPPDAQPIVDAPNPDANAGAPTPQDDSAGPPKASDKPPWQRPSQATSAAHCDWCESKSGGSQASCRCRSFCGADWCQATSEGKHSALLITDAGVALPLASVMRRLALAHADDREAVLEDVRASRG